jgi:hypothetical protein
MLSRSSTNEKSAPFSDEVMLSQSGDATPIRPITGRHSLPPISDTRIIIVRLTAFYLLRGTIRAYPVPLD